MEADQKGREKGRRFDPHPEEAEVVGDQGQDQGPQGSEPEARIAPGGLAGWRRIPDLVGGDLSPVGAAPEGAAGRVSKGGQPLWARDMCQNAERFVNISDVPISAML